ncbi:hypothetical protein BTJ40_12810 [Microbulbifer sp. A4B17]|uniref:hypothetical protein n=1 Tax=Microbulbifer sp. A4B17 TaxID=359370 RepID=UPI000D52CFB7|nr:hypothetical protein [Microbulbifer sp. A4B17]AWF81635.1 hypothetical protein BTJ40_12810 [Microbulbifer sp. A4B17]
MIIVDKITEVAEALLQSAKEESVLSMAAFHKLFKDNTLENDKYDTLESASRALAYPRFAI